MIKFDDKSLGVKCIDPKLKDKNIDVLLYLPLFESE